MPAHCPPQLSSNNHPAQLTLYSTTQTKRLSGTRKKLMMVLRISSGTYALHGNESTSVARSY